MKWGRAMLRFDITSSTHLSAISLFGAALLAGQAPYPRPISSYEVVQEKRTYSDFVVSFAPPSDTSSIVEQIVDLYNSFATQQTTLGFEFEKAIFSNTEILYEN